MDIPLAESITVYSRTGEGTYEATWGSGAVSSANVQRTIARVLDANGAEVNADLFVVLPGSVSIKAGDAIEFDSERYHALTVERYDVSGIPSMVQVAAKKVAEALA